ncbi:MAG TPA: hypothetical protein VLZ10_03215 [Thermodesulfobacteriota bacterium]|nr:hypothetical protein [Thermodesulfobacteriota bacterium]
MAYRTGGVVAVLIERVALVDGIILPENAQVAVPPTRRFGNFFKVSMKCPVTKWDSSHRAINL